MSGSTFLQYFLLIDVFFIGVVVAIGVRHAYAHFRPPLPEPEKPHKPAIQNGHLPPAVRDRLLQASQVHFQAVLDRSAAELQHDLKTTALQLNKQLERLGTTIISSEMQRYQADIDKLRTQAETVLGSAQTEVSEHQAELKAKLIEEIAAEKERLLQQIDTKLADAVTSFLIETLQHNVDLGAQTAYLTAMLEEHKADFKRRITDEA